MGGESSRDFERNEGEAIGLLETQEQLRLLVESVKDYAIFLLDVEGRILTWNAGAQRIKGYTAEEILGKHVSVFYEPEERRAGKPETHFAEAVAKGRCEDEGWRVRKDGSRFWAKAIITAIYDQSGRLRGFGKVSRDMTSERAAEQDLQRRNADLGIQMKQDQARLDRYNHELRTEVSQRRRAESDLARTLEQLRALTGYMLAIREEDRKKISREVHDELGQSLTAIKIELTWVMQRLSQADQPIRQRIQSTLRLIDETVQSVRRIAAELRPGILDDLGLAPAIEWQAQEFQTRTGIACELRLPPEDIPLDPERATATFRIFQEVLNNVVRHARATQVRVRMMRSAGTLVLEIRDNGRGITDKQIDDPKSLGLLGMKERALQLGGQVAVLGEPGKGTTVVVQIPLENPHPAPRGLSHA